MDKTVTGEDVLAGRFYLEMTQAELSVALGTVGITTINRWENGHSLPCIAWARHIDTYFIKHIGSNWRRKARNARFTKLLDVRNLANGMGIKLRVRPYDTSASLKMLHESLQREKRKRKKKGDRHGHR